MKRILSTIMISLFATGFIFSQSVNWGDFENDSSMWTNGWGGNAPMVMDNPFPTAGNMSSKVLMYEPTAGWQGISHWFMGGVLDSTDHSISLDVYADSACNIQLTMVNSVDSAPEVFIKDTVIPNQWNHIVFDITNIPAYDYQNIAFQNNELVTYYFDNIMVNGAGGPDTSGGWTEFDIDNIVYGTVDDSTDFYADVKLKWDIDTLHIMFDVTDDSIVTSGATYQVDNIELYLDLDNSKKVHWPRNGAYVNNDTTFDDNDFQLRLVPGMAWNYTTENQQIGGVNYQFTVDSTGYTFHLAIPWDSLATDTTLGDFNPDTGMLIGFDVLISDNDAVASDPNRNQITFNSPTVYPYNDPSLWGTLRLDSGGYFTQIPDTTAPVAPTNVAATASGSTVNLTWDQTLVNNAPHQYIILRNSTAVDTVLATRTANKASIMNVAQGTYVFSVIAIDVYGNASDTVSSDSVTVTGGVKVKDTNVAKLKVYPNPASSYVKISNLKGEGADLRIFNTAGQLVLKQAITDNENVNISSLRSGIYTIEINDRNQVSHIKMIKK